MANGECVQAVRRLVAERKTLHERNAGRERTILCFGDSNTWGYPPGGGERLPRDIRWPGALQRLLGEGYHVIEEGLNGRTATVEHPWVEGRSGRPYLLPCCRSHAPLDLVIIYLGTNDLADRYQLSAADIAQACASLVRVVRAADCGRGSGTPRCYSCARVPSGQVDATLRNTRQPRRSRARSASALLTPPKRSALSFSTSTALSGTQKRIRCTSTPMGSEHSRRQSSRSHAG